MIRRNKVGLVCLLAVLVLTVPTSSNAQAVRHLEVDAVSARAGDGSENTRLDVYTRIPYSSLRFISSGEGFVASYDVRIAVHELRGEDRAGSLLQAPVVSEQRVVARDFAQTRTEQLYHPTMQSLRLAPGRYLLDVQLQDGHSNETFSQEVPVEVRDLRGATAISDLILIEAYDPQANSITPVVSNRIGSEQRSVKFFYEVYANQPRDVHVEREIVRVRKSSSPPSVRSFLGMGRGDEMANAEVAYQQTEPRRMSRGRNPFVVEIPLDEFKVGEYVARVSILDDAGRVIDRTEKSLALHWTGLAEHIRDLDEAIAQLRYIAKASDIQHIQDGRTQEERLRRFREFWERRDPTPGSDRNERMEEYYYRIAYANRNFGQVAEGWQTDRGRVFFRFGEPDLVERQASDVNARPLEVWYYNRIGRRFIFIDRTGFGDFELHVPSWDDEGRVR